MQRENESLQTLTVRRFDQFFFSVSTAYMHILAVSLSFLGLGVKWRTVHEQRNMNQEFGQFSEPLGLQARHALLSFPCQQVNWRTVAGQSAIMQRFGQVLLSLSCLQACFRQVLCVSWLKACFDNVFLSYLCFQKLTHIVCMCVCRTVLGESAVK